MDMNVPIHALIMRPVLACFIECIACVLATFPVMAIGGAPPSFDCTMVHSEVLKTICNSSRLSALDAELNELYTGMRGQPAFNSKLFEQEEIDWLHRVRDRCADVDCLARAYTNRIAKLKDQSKYTASPAAYEETRPFPAPVEVLSEAQAYIGQPCDRYASDERGFVLPGFHKPKGFFETRSPSMTLFVREKNDTRFIFLAKYENGACRFSDLTVLPSATLANEFLNCSYGEAPDISEGVGIRRMSVNRLMAYWEVDKANGKLVRQPLSVLGVEDAVRCIAIEGDY